MNRAAIGGLALVGCLVVTGTASAAGAQLPAAIEQVMDDPRYG